ncbi:hypothetical protein ACWDGI_39075 [Streptomyces sp. NPDC001220]
MIDAKREDRELPQVPEPEKPAGKVLDLMAALRKSVDKAKVSRGEGTGTDAEVHEMPKKKTTGKTRTSAQKTTTAKKTAAKETTVKKTATRRSGRSA